MGKLPNMKGVKQSRQLILKAFSGLLGGIIRLALRNGVTYKEFTQICKTHYVDIATREFGIQGRPTNMSRVGLMTGLDRKEIKKEMVANDKSVEDGPAPDKISRILTAWHSTPPYCNAQRKPILLPLEGDSPNFTELAKQYAGDMPIVTIVNELKRSQTITQDDDGKLKLERYFYIPNYLCDPNKEPGFVDDKAIAHGSSMLIDHINTIFYNLYRHDKGTRERIELRATNDEIDKKKTDLFYQLIDKKGMEFLYEIDDWLQENETKDPNTEKVRLGVGLYFIQGENQNLTLED